jgi:hypothetical protein
MQAQLKQRFVSAMGSPQEQEEVDTHCLMMMVVEMQLEMPMFAAVAVVASQMRESQRYRELAVVEEGQVAREEEKQNLELTVLVQPVAQHLNP